MRVVRDTPGLDACAGGVLVPTMGALHEGHLALIRRAIAERGAAGIAGPVLVSIFVNPTQFDEPSDFQRYPKTLDADLQACRDSGVDLVFAPSVDVMYPPDERIPAPPLPQEATRPGLEDACRPGHFAGVCQVVSRLFSLTRPASAVFGEKDWQQYRVVSSMVESLGSGVRIVAEPTAREPDGLALSSRNRFLSPDERSRALSLQRALEAASRATSPIEAESLMRVIMSDRGVSIDYAVIRDAMTLMPTPWRGGVTGPMRALVAGRVGSVRLIDNAPWTPSRPGIDAAL